MTPAPPRVTVGLPVYNGQRYLRNTLDSLIGQTFQDFELVISDNASTDATEDICREYAAQDKRVQYLRNPANMGLAWNHNRLVGIASGDLFKWAGADDSYLPTYLARCVEALDGHPDAILAYPRSTAIDEHGHRLYDYSPEWELPYDSPAERLRWVILKGGHWVNADAVSGVIRVEALRKTRLLPPYLGGDKRPLGELSLLGKFIEVPEHLLFRRFHPGSSGMNNPSSSGYDERSVEWIAQTFKGSPLEGYFPSWLLLRDHLVTIWSCSLPIREKLRLTVDLPRACSWHRRWYLAEIKNLSRLAVHRSRLFITDPEEAMPERAEKDPAIRGNE